MHDSETNEVDWQKFIINKFIYWIPKYYYSIKDFYSLYFPEKGQSNLDVYKKNLFSLTLSFQMFPFDPPESIRKPLVFSCFQGVKREHW